MALAISSIATQGYGATSVARAYARARELLCAQVGQTPRLLGGLLGLWAFHRFRGELKTAQALGDQSLALAPRFPHSPLFAWSHLSAGVGAFWRGDAATAREHLERVLEVADPARHDPQPVFYGQDLCVTCPAISAGSGGCGASPRAPPRARAARSRSPIVSGIRSVARWR